MDKKAFNAEARLRARAAHGWAFRDHTEEETQAIRDWLNLKTDEAPERYAGVYAAVKEQESLPGKRRAPRRPKTATGDPAPRIEWNQKDYADFGKAGGVVLFNISWRTVSSDPQWSMASELPGFNARGRRWKDDSKDALKAKAEKILDNWLKTVGG